MFHIHLLKYSSILVIHFNSGNFMNAKALYKKILIVVPSCFLLLVSCGDSTQVDYPGFTSKLSASLAAIYANPANYQSFTGLVSSKYLQDGLSSADLNTILSADATALPNDVSFPTVTYSNPVVGTCDANGICDLTVTATNSDADAVSITMTLKVNGLPTQLIGDQSKG
jgi:hypothetical protein